MAAMTRSRRSTDKADGMRLSSENRSSNQIRPASTTPCDSTHAATALDLQNSLDHSGTWIHPHGEQLRSLGKWTVVCVEGAGRNFPSLHLAHDLREIIRLSVAA